MFHGKTRLALIALPLVLGLGAAASAALADAETDTGMAPACVLETMTANGGLVLEARFLSETATNGRFEVTVDSVGGGNRASVRQGGGFAVGAGETVTLGRMTLGGTSAHDVALTVRAGGTTYDCAKRFGRGI